MSAAVDLDELAAAIARHPFAYLVTVGDGARAHVLAVSPVMTDAGVVVDGVGRHTQANAAARPDVTLVCPPAAAGDFSLLVDGTATVDGSTVTIAPTKAILHRPALGPDGTRAGSDCAPIG